MVPHGSADRALCRLTSEVSRIPIHSTQRGRQRHRCSDGDKPRNFARLRKVEHVDQLGNRATATQFAPLLPTPTINSRPPKHAACRRLPPRAADPLLARPPFPSGPPPVLAGPVPLNFGG